MNYLPLIKFRKIILLLFGILLLLTLVSGCLEFIDSGPDNLKLQRVIITKVIDGDTAYALFADGKEEKVRFIGIDAPEINHPQKGMEDFGPEAAEYARKHLEGKIVWLEFDIGERDQYERLLAYIWLSVPEKLNDEMIRANMFNAQMLIEGYAVQVIFEPNVKYVNHFSAYEAEAKNSDKGLWGLD
jgi:micrococcal nuclease